MPKITVHPGGFIKRNYVDELGLNLAELAEVLEISEADLVRLLDEKIDLSPQLAVKLSKVLGCSAQSWINMQTAHTLAQHEAELDNWAPAHQLDALSQRKAS